MEFVGTAPKVQLIESQGKVSLTLTNTALAEDQLVELSVADFGTVVSTIETFEDENDARIEINYSGQVTVKNTVKDSVLRVAISPMDSEQQEALGAEKQYTGDPISLDFQDVPVRQVLQIIAQVNGFNLVTTDTVSGNVTISLSGVPWDQALDMILRVKGLDKRLEGNILLIAPAEELSARETQALQSKKQVSDLAPLHTVNISVNYAKASALATILKSTEGGILSERGGVTVDERTNTLLIRDTLASIDEANFDFAEVYGSVGMGGLSLTVYLLAHTEADEPEGKDFGFAQASYTSLDYAFEVLNGTELGLHVGYHEGDFAEAFNGVEGYVDYGISLSKDGFSFAITGTDLEDMGGDDEFDNDAVKFTVGYSMDFQL